jgi:hypothetical protein
MLYSLGLAPKQVHSIWVTRGHFFARINNKHNHFRFQSSCSPSHHKLCKSEARTTCTSIWSHYHTTTKQKLVCQPEQLQHSGKRMGAGIWLLQAHHFQPYQANIHSISDEVTTLSAYCCLIDKFIRLRALTATSMFDVFSTKYQQKYQWHMGNQTRQIQISYIRFYFLCV